MERIEVAPRDRWKERVENLGFSWSSMYDAPYWDESHAYRFSLAQIENELEDPTADLLTCCYHAVAHAVDHSSVLTKLQIPEQFHDYVRNSWRDGSKDLYGRFDFAYNGSGHAKMLEFNADTPTSLYESAVVQWDWLESSREAGAIPKNADQFNSLHEKLIEAFKRIGIRDKLHLAVFTEAIEDFGTVNYLADCAVQAGLKASVLDIAHLGIDSVHNLIDEENLVIDTLFKLYPWEMMIRDEGGASLLKSNCKIIEPPWKMILSNKGLLPLMWELFPGHPNLLPAYFADDPRAEKLTDFALKPIFSREGENVTLVKSGKVLEKADGSYGAEGFVKQQLVEIPKFGNDYTIIGSWYVAGEPAGICIREDADMITKNLSRFVPHFID